MALKQLSLILCSIFLLTASLAETPPPTKVTSEINGGARLWNLQDADILSVINEVSRATGKNFAVDPRVTGKVTLVSSKPIKPNEVYQVFLSVIELLGYSAIQSGNVIKIVPNMESGEYATHVANEKNPGKGDEVVARVIPLENVAANQLIPIIRPMLPQWSNVSAYIPGNVLILVGRAANLQRIVDVVHNIDHTSDNEIDVIPLHQASAAQVATVLNNLQNASRAQGENPQVSIAANERNNSILLSGNKSARMRMHLLISQLDTPSTGAQGNTEVVYLRYLQAKDFAPLLGKIAQNILGKATTADAAVSVTTASTTATNPPPVGTQVPPGSPEPVETKETTPENRTIIQAEPNTNSLIITAPPTLMTALKCVVSQLDIRPAQVLVEAILVEVDEGDLKDLGIQWGSRTDAPNLGFTSTSTNINTPTVDGFSPLGAGVFGIIPNTQIKAVLTMLQTITGVNVLSTPTIVVLDNQKATLEIGQQVPMQTGSYATTGSATTVTPFNTIANQNVTLKMDVTPQINLGNSVRLKIAIKNDTLQNPNNPTLNPRINTSKIENSVLIESNDVLVLGGLISDSITENIDKVPIIGNLPVIGRLFQEKSRQLTKKNLMVFIKPIILRNPEDASCISSVKYNMVRDQQLVWPQGLTYGQTKFDAMMPLYNRQAKLPKPFGEPTKGCGI